MKTEITKRSVDNKFMLWGFTVDPCYKPEDIDETNIPFIPQRWIILGVFDEKYQAQKEQNVWSKQQSGYAYKENEIRVSQRAV